MSKPKSSDRALVTAYRIHDALQAYEKVLLAAIPEKVLTAVVDRLELGKTA